MLFYLVVENFLMTHMFKIGAEISSIYKQIEDTMLLGPVLANVTLRSGAETLDCMALCNTWGSPTDCEHGNLLLGGVCQPLGFTVGLPAQVVQPGVVSFTRINGNRGGKNAMQFRGRM